MTSSTATRLRIDLAYDGGSYAGFARQPDQTTVQGVLEDALARVMGHDVDITCAGRTDRGVHALAQVVHVDVDPGGLGDDRGVRALADLEVLRERIDRMAGAPISVTSITAVDETFHARFSATSRAYRYRLATHPADPRLRAVVWHVDGPLDLEAMSAALPGLLGEHDFAAFCRKAPGRPTTRRLLGVDVHAHGDGDQSGLTDEVRVDLRGTAFCHQMVRAIVGSLMEVGQGRQCADWLREVLDARDRSLAGPVAPPHGLTLMEVRYDPPWPSASWWAHEAVLHGGRAAPASG